MPYGAIPGPSYYRRRRMTCLPKRSTVIMRFDCRRSDDCCRLARHNHHHQVIPGPRSFQALYPCPPYHILGLLWVTTRIFQALRLDRMVCAWMRWAAELCNVLDGCPKHRPQESSGFPMRCLRPPSPQFSMPWLELGILKGGVPRSSGERLHLFYGM